MLPASEGDRITFPARRPISILVAEDSPVYRRLLQDLLEPLGFEVSVAENGREAVSLVQEERIDLVFMDLQMPELDGFQATRAIRELSPPKSAVPVIAVTSLSLPTEREAWHTAGISDYLSKPVHKSALLSVLETWIRTFQPEWPALVEPASPMSAKSDLTPPDQTLHASTEVMMLEVALARMGNDRTLLLQLAEFFLEDAPKLLAEIDSGWKTNDTAAIRRAAHSLKGLAANFEALPAVAAAQRVEEDGRQPETARLQSNISLLLAEIDRLMQALASEVVKARNQAVSGS